MGAWSAGLSRFLRGDEKTRTTIVLETMSPAGLQPPSGDVVDASAAAIMLNLAAIGVRTSTIAGVCATSESSVKRVQRHAAQHSGVARVPCKGKGKRHDPRWHFGGALGQSNLARLDRLMASMDASSTLEEIYAAYVATCPPPVPKPSTVAKAVLKLEYTTKRLSAYAPDRNDLRCRAWHQRVASLYRRDQFVCIDEVGVNEKSANRNRGRSKRGMPAVTHLNVLAGGSKKSALGVFTEEGFIDVHVVDGAFDTDAFFTAVDESVVRLPPCWSRVSHQGVLASL